MYQPSPVHLKLECLIFEVELRTGYYNITFSKFLEKLIKKFRRKRASADRGPNVKKFSGFFGQNPN